jgi:hypothetical protein
VVRLDAQRREYTLSRVAGGLAQHGEQEASPLRQRARKSVVLHA